MSYRPKYLAHVNVYVRDVERSHKWYADLLGLHTYDYRPGAAAFMSADQDESHEIALMQVGADAPLQEAGQVGLNHMAAGRESRRSEGFLSPAQRKGGADHTRRRSWDLARYLFPRSRRQRHRGLLRIAATGVAAAGSDLRGRYGWSRTFPRPLGRGDRRAASCVTGRRAGPPATCPPPR